MQIKDFKDNLIDKANLLNISISENECNELFKYVQILLEWNKVMNLTAITEMEDIILKHLIDSITINKYINNKKRVMDIGTGAGFPGIPLKIINKDIEFILVDSLNKRIGFLNEVKQTLGLSKLELIHSRAEDLARNEEYRENNDVVVSRAVASLNTLVEYMIPFVKVGGLCICMKGPNSKKEVQDAENAIKILGGKIEKVETILLPKSEIERNIVIIKKIENTNNKYPRKAGIPTRKPL